MATKTLYVGNLSYQTSVGDLQAHFGTFGASNPRIIEGRGFGFIDIDSDQMAAAISATDQKELSGRTLNVKEALPKGDRPAPSSGGGYGGSRRNNW